MNQQGYFITVEGVEGVGKSTNIAFIQKTLVRKGCDVVVTREPGGTPLAEEIREMVLQPRDEVMASLTELLLVFAARAQHIEQVIKPALDRGAWVVCDRFTDATYAYQGGGRHLPIDQIQALEQLVQNHLRPDLTILLDVDAEVGLKRARSKGQVDRIEAEKIDFFSRVRDTYLSRASDDPGRFRIIDTERALEEVQADIDRVLSHFVQEQ